MNQFYNSWPEEQQHLQRHQDLLREAEQKRLVRLARGEAAARRRGALSIYAYAVWDYLSCRLHTLRVRLPARTHPVTSPECR